MATMADQRRAFRSTDLQLEVRLINWSQQTDEQERPLSVESALQSLLARNEKAAHQYCRRVEDVVLDAAAEMQRRLAELAVDSLKSIGWNCVAIEWLLEE